ncbi:hypothetical protein EON67_08020 [archaeon]|nr:MAG: hypothetical protein EON67_08020 [archaeon]
MQSFKFVELLSVNFGRSSDEVVRQQIAFRYNSVKSKLAVLQARLQDVVNLVKIKNPSLLLQLQKPAAGGASSATPGLAPAPAPGSSTMRNSMMSSSSAAFSR